MSSLALFFRAELVKWRKSWVLLTVLLAPICQSGFLFVILWFSDDLVQRFKPGFLFWIELNYLTWNLVFLPLTVALVSELSWDLEEESKAWNHLLIQPVPRHIHYFAKLLSHLALVFLSQLFMALLLIPEGLILKSHLGLIMGGLTQPDWQTGLIPLKVMIQFAGFSCLASIPLVAFHTWLSTRFTGLGIALTTAVAGTWFCAHLAGTTALVQLIPWGMTGQILTFFDRLKRHIPWEFFPGSLLCAAILMALGILDFSRRKEPRS